MPYCKYCGDKKKKKARFCKKCGKENVQRQAVQAELPVPPSPQPEAHAPVLPQPQPIPNGDYQPQNCLPQYGFGQPADYRKSRKGLIPLIVLAVFFVTAIVSIWLPWYKVESSAITVDYKLYNASASTNTNEWKYSYSDVLFHEGEYKTTDGKFVDISELYGDKDITVKDKGTKKMNNMSHVMKYAGLAGYILLIIAAIAFFFSKKAMAFTAAFSSAAFVVAVIGGNSFCSETQKAMNDGENSVFYYSLGSDVHLGIGIILALVTVLLITVTGFVIAFRKKKTANYNY